MRINNKYGKNTKLFISTGLVMSAATIPFSVASAESPFKDVEGNTHEAAINALAQRNILNGYANGDFKPYEQLTRGHVVKILGRYLVEENNISIPDDYKTNMRFVDLTGQMDDELLRYAAVVGDSNIFIGSDGNLNPGSYINREQIALVVMRLFNKHFNINSTAYLESQPYFTSGITDINKASSGAVDAINMVDYFDITVVNEYQPKTPTIRGQFASFIHRLLMRLENEELEGKLEEYKQQVLIQPNQIDVSMEEKALKGSGARSGTELTVKDAAGTIIGTATVNNEGSYTIPLKVDENTKAPITIEATHPDVGDTNLTYTDIDITDLAGDVGQDGDGDNSETPSNPGIGTPGGSDSGGGTPGGSTPGETPGEGTPGGDTPGESDPGEETPEEGDPGEETPVETATLEEAIAAAEAIPQATTSANGNNVPTTEQWTTEEALAAFTTAITRAQAVLENEEATQQQINEAVTALTAAVSAYEESKQFGLANEEQNTIDKSALEGTISSARSVNRVVASTDGSDVPKTEQWTTEIALTAFTEAIEVAEAMLENDEATQSQVNEAVTGLTEAIAVYLQAKQFGTGAGDEEASLETAALERELNTARAINQVGISPDGNDIPTTEQWTTEEVLKTFTEAIEAAEALLDNEDATQVQVNEAVTALAEAIAAYEQAKQFGTEAVGEEAPLETAALERELATARAINRVGTSADGNDIPATEQWTTEEVLTTFTEAIEAAEALLDNEDATQVQVNEAVTALAEAIAAYEQAKQFGTEAGDEEAPLEKAALEIELATARAINQVGTSADGNDIPATEQWTTEAALTEFNDAIANAESVLVADGATQEEINNTLDMLKAAIIAYEGAKQFGSEAGDEEAPLEKAALERELVTARAINQVGTSADGNDIPATEQWTTEAALAAFTGAIEAAEALLVNEEVTQEQVDDAVAALMDAIALYERAKAFGGQEVEGGEEAPVDTVNLAEVLAAAEAIARAETSVDGSDIPATELWTTEAALSAFTEAITNAQSLLTDETATQGQVNEAVMALTEAIAAYEDAKEFGSQEESEELPVETGALTEAVEAARAITPVETSEDGNDIPATEQWTTEEALTAFTDAIENAEAILADGGSTQEEINEALSALTEAVVAYEEAKQTGTQEAGDGEETPVETGALTEAVEAARAITPVETSEDGSNIPVTEQWTTEEALTAFTDAITDAETVLEDEEATQEEVNETLIALTEAIAAYERAKQLGTQKVESGEEGPVETGALTEAIEAARAITPVETSEDGSDIPATEQWTTEEALTAFTDAITNAEAVLEDEEATQEVINEALKALTEAIAEYERAKKSGTQEETEELPVETGALEEEIEAAESVTRVATSQDGRDIPATVLWTTEEELNAFTTAIASAQEIVTNGEVTQEEVNEALAALTEAIAVYEAAKKLGTQQEDMPESAALRQALATAITVDRVDVSTDGNDIPETEEWTTQEALDAFESAISAADDLINDTTATPDQLEEGVVTLNAAIEAYENAKSSGTQQNEPAPVNKEALQGLLQDAQGVELVDVSDDGSDIEPGLEWTTVEVREAFVTARENAVALSENPQASQGAVDTAADELRLAMERYENAKQQSTQGLQAEYETNQITVSYQETERTADLGDIQADTTDLSFTTLSAALGPVLSADVLSSDEIGANFIVEDNQEFNFDLRATVSGVLGAGSLDLAVYKRTEEGYERVWNDNLNYLTALGIPIQNKYNFETPYFGPGEFVFVTSPSSGFALNLISGGAIRFTDTSLRERTVVASDGGAIQATGTVEFTEGATITQVRSLNNEDTAVDIDNTAVVEGQYGTLTIDSDTGGYIYTSNGSLSSVGQMDEFEYTIESNGETVTNKIVIQTSLGSVADTAAAMSITSKRLPMRYELVNTLEAADTVNYNVLN